MERVVIHLLGHLEFHVEFRRQCDPPGHHPHHPLLGVAVILNIDDALAHAVNAIESSPIVKCHCVIAPASIPLWRPLHNLCVVLEYMRCACFSLCHSERSEESRILLDAKHFDLTWGLRSRAAPIPICSYAAKLSLSFSAPRVTEKSSLDDRRDLAPVSFLVGALQVVRAHRPSRAQHMNRMDRAARVLELNLAQSFSALDNLRD